MSALRLLLFISDPLTADVRLKPLLDRLVEAGRLHYACVDRDMNLSGSVSERYDVLLAHRNLSRRQTAWLRNHPVPFVYDIDDLLLEETPPASSRRAAQQHSIRWCLSNAASVTAPSRRLLAELERLSDGTADRARLVPNPGQELIPPAKTGPSRQVLWTSSALPMGAADLDEVCAGIADAVKASGLELLLVGKFSAQLQALLGPARLIPWLAPEAYLELLRCENLIAVAPLSRRLSPAQQRFADCKSDIKIAHYASSRIAGVYSDAPPFADSELPRTIVSNTREAWRDALIGVTKTATEVGNALAENPLIEARRPSHVAAEFYDILGAAAATGEPFRFRAIPTPDIGRRIEMAFRSLTTRLKPARPGAQRS